MIHTLVLIPAIRTSHYLTSLLSAIPSLCSCAPGAINVDMLPELRNVLVVDDISGCIDPSNLSTSTSGSGLDPDLGPDLGSRGLGGKLEVDQAFTQLLANTWCAVDFREAFAWDSTVAEFCELEEIRAKVSVDDMVNLQLTRYDFSLAE